MSVLEAMTMAVIDSSAKIASAARLELDARLTRQIAGVDGADTAGSEQSYFDHLDPTVGERWSSHSCAGSFLKCHSRVGPAITFR